MIIRIKKHTKDFLVMDKRPLRDDKRLSWKAKGILAYLLSLPDNWEINRSEIANHSKDGITAFDSGLKELCDTGYCTRTQIRNNEGKYSGYTYTIVENPELGNLNTDNTNSENLTLYNIYNTNIDKTQYISYIKRHRKEILDILGLEVKKKKNIRKYPDNSEEKQLAQLLLENVESYDPFFEKPDLDKWSGYFSKMIYKEHKKPEDIKDMILYIRNNKFWHDKIDSPYKLSNLYGKIFSSRKREELFLKNKRNNKLDNLRNNIDELTL